MRTTALALLVLVAACNGSISTSGNGGGGGSNGGGAGGGGGFVCDAPSDDGGVTTDVLTPHRLLRRASLTLKGAPPTDAEYAALDALPDEAAQHAYVTTFIDGVLNDPAFYQSMFELGRDWFNIPLVPRTADEPEYGPQQQRSLQQCDAGTPNAGKWAYFREDYLGGRGLICNGALRDGGVPLERSVEPWWAPGTTVTLVGSAASTADAGITNNNGWVNIECNGRPDGTCGCGPNAVNCHPDFQYYAGWESYAYWNPTGQRRELSEEPARLLAHLAWYDRPVTDLVLGTKSVGTTNTIAAYVMQGAESGDLTELTDDSWWRPAKYLSAPTDPLHTPGDPDAWREFDVPTYSRVFIADRDYHFDPRTQSGQLLGMPAAGMLTSLGFLAAQPRERLRAARMLEALACEVLSPPSGGQTFNPYQRDPASEGPCQNCHRRIDPAAIHFKRFGKLGNAFEGWGAKYLMPGIGNWTWPKVWRTGAYPYVYDPFTQYNRWYVADMKMTPVSQARIDEDPMSVFIDFLPPDQTLLNQVSDGTVGPLGFAKMIVAAGNFDRCVVRHLHQLVMGRDIDPAKEAGYLDQLTQDFVGGGRKIRPFVKELTQSDLFQRGF